MIDPYVADLKHAVKDNENFRKVLFTGSHTQLVLMSIAQGEDIGLETHADVDQVLYIVDGEGVAILDGKESRFEKGSVVCVPAGTEHNIVNGGEAPLKLFTLYSPPEHAPGTVQKTKPKAEAALA